MDIRYSTGKEPFKTMTTEELRKEFLISNIFVKNDVSAVYSHIDRIVTLGAMPVDKKVKLDKGLFSLDGFVTIDESSSMVIGEDGVFSKKEHESTDLYLFVYLNDFSKCLEDYYKITGFTPLIPRWRRWAGLLALRRLVWIGM